MLAGPGFYLIGPGSYDHVPWDIGISIVAASGFTSIDVSASKGARVATSDGFAFGERAQLRALADAAGLRIEAVVTHLGLADTIRSGSALDIPGAVEVAGDLGSSIVLVHVGAAGSDRDELWPAAVAEFRRAADHAAARGITICLDALAPDFLTASPQDVARFLAEVDRPNVGWNFDPAFAFASGFAPADVEEYLGRWIRHVHLKDVRGRYPDVEWQIPGSGDLDQAAWLEVLRRIDYEGSVTAEVIAKPGGRPERWPLAEAARRSYDAIAAIPVGRPAGERHRRQEGNS